MPRLFRFRRFRTRLLFIILGLLTTALTTSYILVTRANRANAEAHIADSLAGAMRVFRFSVELRQNQLAQSAKVVSADWPMRALYIQPQLDRRTLQSTLESYVERLQVPVVASFDTDGEMLAATMPGLTNELCDPFRDLITEADEQASDQASDFAYLGGKLHVLTVVPLYAPRPNIIGWFAVAFPIDDAFALALKKTTQAEVTFISGLDKKQPQVLATTLSMDRALTVATDIPYPAARSNQTSIISLNGEPYVTLRTPIGVLGDAPARIALQRSLTVELAPSRELENIILLISLTALMVATIAATAAARGVSQPVQALAAHTEVVARGDYEARLDTGRGDEFGQLAASFNRMTAGLAERDQVRDLLDKNVSPEVAAQLMRDGAALGGEEREVTILFTDLRGFTSLSENLAPRELIELLNRYLDRMSTEIERHGGVIDKYIGDAIMAVFGAPLTQPDDADRALQCALAMQQALLKLNRELAAEGLPELANGAGINTARVVAGNIGSHRRLNYSVIGDGVNVAARLESLTRNPDYRATILVSEATLKAAHQTYTTRDLGAVSVKGRRESVHLFALDS